MAGGGKEQRRGHDAKRIERREHGHDDARVAVARRDVGHHLVVEASDLADAGQPGEPSGEGRGQQHHPADRNSPMRGRARVGADGADLKAKRGARDQEPDDDRCETGEQHA